MGFLIGNEQIWQLPWWMAVCVTRVSQWSGSRQTCNCGQDDFTSLRMEGTDCRPRLVAQHNDSLQDFLGLFFLLTAQVAFLRVWVPYSFCFIVSTLSILIILGWHNMPCWTVANKPSKWSETFKSPVKALGCATLWAIPQGWFRLQGAGDPSCLLFIRSCRDWQSGNRSQQAWFLRLWANYLSGLAWVSFGTSLAVKLRITILTTQWGSEFSHWDLSYTMYCYSSWIIIQTHVCMLWNFWNSKRLELIVLDNMGIWSNWLVCSM